MKIFITGTTGYIGFNVAKKLRQAGHEVWGLTRNESKSDLLRQNEIHPVIGDMKDPGSYRKYAEAASLLIHAAVDYVNGQEALDKKQFRH